jgi:hypothetical protein
LGICPGDFLVLEDVRWGGKDMAVRKIAVVLWVLAAAIALFLAVHFAGQALFVFEKCLALSLVENVAASL